MSAKTAFLILSVCLTVGAWPAWAGAPMGPTLPIIEKGQWAFGVEYAYEKIDVGADGTCVESIVGGPSESYRQKFTIDGMKTHMFYGRIEYALCTDWDVFVRLGAARSDADVKATGPGVIIGRGAEAGLDAGYGFSAGLGTRATFYRSGPWRIDGLAQVTWLDPDDSRFRITNRDDSSQAVAGTAKLEYLQGQIALAAAYRAKTWGLWGGPFVQIIDGDLDLDARFLIDGASAGRIKCSADVEEESWLGLSLGADCELTQNLTGWIGGQITEDSWLVGIGILVRPDRLLGDW